MTWMILKLFLIKKQYNYMKINELKQDYLQI